MEIEKYFKEKIINKKKIEGHFNINYKVTTELGDFHLKIFRNKSYEIKKWIKGEVVKKWDKQTIKLVCVSLKELHSQDNNWEKMDYHKLDIKDTKYLELVNKYENVNMVSCHNDLNKDNIIISSNKAIFIDFEFKRTNNYYWDIANIINEENLSKKQIGYFIQYYSKLDIYVLKDFIYINKIFVDNWKQKHIV